MTRDELARVRTTRQGVRDLGGNDRRPRRTPLPPDVKRFLCRHPRDKRHDVGNGYDFCAECNHYILWSVP